MSASRASTRSCAPSPPSSRCRSCASRCQTTSSRRRRCGWWAGSPGHARRPSARRRRPTRGARRTPAARRCCRSATATRTSTMASTRTTRSSPRCWGTSRRRRPRRAACPTDLCPSKWTRRCFSPSRKRRCLSRNGRRTTRPPGRGGRTCCPRSRSRSARRATTSSRARSGSLRCSPRAHAHSAARRRTSQTRDGVTRADCRDGTK
mmetsp:Transcript_6694/g.17127  ORF Transcript_6694/g.17127 Transcript_6694/m.17127 type:complete len:206 (-) Transcript_6694:175-792(-)